MDCTLLVSLAFGLLASAAIGAVAPLLSGGTLRRAAKTAVSETDADALLRVACSLACAFAFGASTSAAMPFSRQLTPALSRAAVAVALTFVACVVAARWLRPCLALLLVSDRFTPV
jgi:hypothetical protein